MISNVQHPSELYVNQNEQKVNKQIERDLVIKTKYQDDRHDDLDDQTYIGHPTIGQMQNPYFDQRQYRPNLQRQPEDLQPSGYLKGLADLHTENVLGCILTGIMHHLK